MNIDNKDQKLILADLKRKYSGQVIPEWELQKIQSVGLEPKTLIKGNTRKPKLDKDVLKNGNLNPDLH